ncbi:hypothetical protein ACQ7B2_10765, partial [Escherichia coli]
AALPDRSLPATAVNSAGLLGKHFNGMPAGTVLTAANLDSWIRPQLPAQGVRQTTEDASVWNWSVDRSTGKPIY